MSAGAVKDYPTVVRVETEHGSHIEPPLDEEWTDLEKLRWHAAVAALDGGIDVKVHLTSMGDYSVQIGMSSASGRGFYDAWTYINGAEVGAQAARERIAAAIEAERVRLHMEHPGFSNLDGAWFVHCERIARDGDA